MNRFIDSLKLAYVGFAENMGWNYNIKLSTGSSMSRSSHTVRSVSPIYKFDDEAKYNYNPFKKNTKIIVYLKDHRGITRIPQTTIRKQKSKRRIYKIAIDPYKTVLVEISR